MARKTNTTRPLHAPGGPVSAAIRAIRAVREPVAPWFTPVSAADPMVSGFYVGRRWEWEDSRQEVIWLDVLELDGELSFGVSRCGSRKVEHPADWQFLLRVDGICSTPADLIDITATRH